MSLIAVFFLWLLHFLPLALLSPLGRGLGSVLYGFGKERRRIVKTNLRLCFPELDEARRDALAKAHFQVLGRALIERSLLWWSSPDRLRRLIRIEGEEKIRCLIDAGTPVIMLTPHFVGIDAGGARIAMIFDSLSVYSKQKNKVFDELVLRGRKRFGDQMLLSRQDGMLSTIKAMRRGRPFYYLPDMDFGRRNSIFVPFFGVMAATIPGLARLARVTDAKIVLVTTRVLPGAEGYCVEIGDAWDAFPGADVETDTRRMNAVIEDAIRSMPEQYYWVHRRFKTRPDGEAGVYP
ncbi:MAG: lipid A biosynthesis acyltransferase [Candidatus Accumulibacter sp.]|nr:lipid A biosynthesis acyltransferase [Accumulibacter sp.]